MNAPLSTSSSTGSNTDGSGNPQHCSSEYNKQLSDIYPAFCFFISRPELPTCHMDMTQPKLRQQQGSAVSVFLFECISFRLEYDISVIYSPALYQWINYLVFFPLQCEECRRKKLRCDRKKPQCLACAITSTTCITNEEVSARGPRKGHVNALKNKIGTRIPHDRKRNVCREHVNG